LHLLLEQFHLRRGLGGPRDADLAGRGLQRAHLRADLLGPACRRGPPGDAARADFDRDHPARDRRRSRRWRGQRRLTDSLWAPLTPHPSPLTPLPFATVWHHGSRVIEDHI